MLQAEVHFRNLISTKEERECLLKWKNGDIKSKKQACEHNLRLVAHIAKKYYSSCNDTDELVSIGTIGLIKAVNTFDIDKNIRLSSYASRCIENEVLMYFRNSKKSAQDMSLDDAIDSDSDGNKLTLMDIMSVEEDFVDNLDIKIKSEKLKTYIDKYLTPREKLVITLRYGLDGNDPLTQREIAKKLNISRSYVSRIERKALDTLKTQFM